MVPTILSQSLATCNTVERHDPNRCQRIRIETPSLPRFKSDVALQFRVLDQQDLGAFVKNGPLLTEDVAPDLPLLSPLPQGFANSVAQSAARARGAVAVNQLDDGRAPLPALGDGLR